MVNEQFAAQHQHLSVSSTLQLRLLRAGQVLHMAHCGDSRAVLAAPEAVRLTQDHKPDLPAERQRIEAVGGHVELVKCADSTWLCTVCEHWELSCPTSPDFWMPVLPSAAASACMHYCKGIKNSQTCCSSK